MYRPYSLFGTTLEDALSNGPSGVAEGSLGIVIAGGEGSLVYVAIYYDPSWEAINSFGPMATSVSNFADLGTLSGRPDGYTVTVTAESGLSADTLVQWDEGGGVWRLVRTACDYDTRAAVQWGATPGEWYDSGGVTVDTMDGALLTDTTYDIVLRWRPDATPAKSAWWPADIDWIASVGAPAKGDSATPAGWSISGSPTSAGGKIILSVTASSGYQAQTMTLTDAGLSSAGQAYMSALVQVTALTSGTPTGSSKARVTLLDGTDAYDLGRVTITGSVTVQGSFFNVGSNSSRYTAQSAAEQDLTSTETLIEVRKTGTACMVRAGGGAGVWQTLAGATARNSATKAFEVHIDSYSLTASTTASMTVRHVQTARSA